MSKGLKINLLLRLVVMALFVLFIGYSTVLFCEESIKSYTKTIQQIEAELIKWEKEATEDVRKQIVALRTGDAVLKINAASNLAKLGPNAKGAIKALIELFAKDSETYVIKLPGGTVIIGYSSVVALAAISKGHPITFVASEVINALTAIGDAAVEPLIAALNSDDWKVRGNAADALGEIKDPRATEPLIAVLRDEKEGVAKKAGKALAKISDPRSVEYLIGTLKSEDPNVRGKAAEALAETKDPRAIGPLFAAVKDENWKVRSSAVSVFRWIKDTDGMIAALEDKDSRVRYSAAMVIVGIQDSRLVDPLIKALKDKEHPGVRKFAAQALGLIKNPSAINPLIAALENEDMLVRGSAAEALGEIKDPRAIDPLIAVLKDKDSYVKNTSAYALSKITGKYFGTNPIEWQIWWEKNRAK